MWKQCQSPAFSSFLITCSTFSQILLIYQTSTKFCHLKMTSILKLLKIFAMSNLRAGTECDSNIPSQKPHINRQFHKYFLSSRGDNPRTIGSNHCKLHLAQLQYMINVSANFQYNRSKIVRELLTTMIWPKC